MSIFKISSQELKNKCGFVDFQSKYNDDNEKEIYTCRCCGKTDDKRNFLLQGVFITDQIDCDESFIKKFNKSKDYFFHNGNNFDNYDSKIIFIMDKYFYFDCAHYNN